MASVCSPAVSLVTEAHHSVDAGWSVWLSAR
jgi:hypothetical protein